jgi:hypothetical protein
MSDRPAYVEACKNCTGEPSRYAYGARGYCNHCYRIIKYIEDVRDWNRSCHATLKRIPKDGSSRCRLQQVNSVDDGQFY